MTSAQFAVLTTAQLAAMTTDQIVAIETRDLYALTDTQVAALTPAQLTALGTADHQSALFGLTPLVLDLNGDGVHTLPRQAGVLFDLAASGTPASVGWVSPHDGLLVIDRNNDGVVNNGSELFGSSTPDGHGGRAHDGFAALRLEDTNHDGVVNAQDLHYSQLKVWVDANSDGISQPGELHSLTDMGIVSLQLEARPTVIIDNGNLVGLMGSYTTADGVRHTLGDVWLQTGDPQNRTFDLSSLRHTPDGAGALSKIDLSGNGGHGDVLKVNANDVLAFGATDIVSGPQTGAGHTQMLVKGDASDTVMVDNSDGGWTRAGSTVVGGVSYAIYNHGHAQLLIDEKLNVLM